MRPMLFALALTFTACTQTTPTETKANTTAVAETKAASNVHGQAFEKKDVVNVSAIVKDATPYLNKTVQIEGKISAVCQKKGCWMELTDADTQKKVRIFVGKGAAGYAFTVPTDCSGKIATVQGTLTSIEVSQADAAHMAEEAGQPIPTGPVQELRLTATGVILSDS